MASKAKAFFFRLKWKLRSAQGVARLGWGLLLLGTLPIVLPIVAVKAVTNGKKARTKPRGLSGSASYFVSPSTVPKPETDDMAEAASRARPHTYALIRIVGNDLPPRHAVGQSLQNVQFILNNEPEFPNCTKMWVLNRIRDAEQEARIIKAIDAAGHAYKRFPFVSEDYEKAPLDVAQFPTASYIFDDDFDQLDDKDRSRALAAIYRLKNIYAMHNNGARNAALEWGLADAKWVLPWDGNCFVTSDDWAGITTSIEAQEALRYFVVPMARLGSNASAFDPMTPQQAGEEPQLAFRFDARERYDEAFPYGRRPKVELLARLGVEGPWMRTRMDPWDIRANPRVPASHLVGRAGMVRRLASGQVALETDGYDSLRERGFARNDAIVAQLRSLDRQVMERRGYDLRHPVFYDRDTVAHLGQNPTSDHSRRLREAADSALGRGPFSVFDKTETAPSRDKGDYLELAPYWWPDAQRRDDAPYVQRTGERLPGTVLYTPDSDAFDRTRLQHVFDDATACSLAWVAFGAPQYRDHARRLIKAWFLDQKTAMTPHLRYAQVRRGHNENNGDKAGIIAFKDIAYLLDGVRMLDDPDLSAEMADWLRPYRDWLLGSAQGRGACRTPNNLGMFHDLQLASIAAFLGDVDTLMDCYLKSTARLEAHFDDEGRQPQELQRSAAQHHCAFNLSGWLSLYRLYQSCGFALEHQPEFARLRKGVAWFLSHRGAEWPHNQGLDFDEDRYAPLAMLADSLGMEATTQAGDESIAHTKPRFHPYDGLPGFWPLMMSADRAVSDMNKMPAEPRRADEFKGTA
ncbi:alginate lyase family protein [uncultured Tateyamaria sp.]|uniref:alginate lyase family protein n=1 Tax=uncultured Tateyamaria sp. TaxID=455651 RepID=UPI0026266E39|nr:alginate lyase family protein [uncultured Tateyamaria sp.]